MGRADNKFRQPFQIFVSQRHEPLAFIRQQVLRELRAQNCQTPLDLFHPLFLIPDQGGTGAHSITVRDHQNPCLFVGQIKRIAGVPNGGDAFKQRLIAGNFGKMRGQFRGEIALQCLAGRVAVRPCHGEKHA